MDLKTRTIHGYAGSSNRVAGSTGDGLQAQSALLNYPTDVIFDAEDALCIADARNHGVRRVKDAKMRTVAGKLTLQGFDGDGGQGTSAQLDTPIAVLVDHRGHLYIADSGGASDRVRRVIRVSTAKKTADKADLYGEPVSIPSMPVNGHAPLGVRVGNRGPASVDGGQVTVTVTLPPELVSSEDHSKHVMTKKFDGQALPPNGLLDGTFQVFAPETTKPGLHHATAEIIHTQNGQKPQPITFPLTVMVVADADVSSDPARLHILQTGMASADTKDPNSTITVLMQTRTGHDKVKTAPLHAVFKAPSGWHFTGWAGFGHHPNGSQSGELTVTYSADRKTASFEAAPHLNLTAGDREPLNYSFSVAADSDASAGVTDDGEARIGALSAALQGYVKKKP